MTFAERADQLTLQCGKRAFQMRLRHFEGGISHLQIFDEDRLENGCLLDLIPPANAADGPLSFHEEGHFSLALSGVDSALIGRFGVCEQTSMFAFEVPEDARFFGMGEKYFESQERSGLRSKFYNTDVWSDFHFGQWEEHPTDPPYYTAPYLAVKVGESFFGLLLHNPYPAFIETPGIDESRVFVEWQRTDPFLLMGNEGGQPNLWIIEGPTLADVTRKMQSLVGKTPRPPLWSLGYQQSRWGYRGEADLLEIDRLFTENDIPCSGLWMDLDYMDDFRIFTLKPGAFPNGVHSCAQKLAQSGRRIVPIIDPGVKRDPGYAVFDDGIAKNAFCLTPEGRPFVGLVWPGETIFPDFTLGRVREWWKEYAKDFRLSGFGACWVDMNDPSTGPVEPKHMLFKEGTEPHFAHRNQYALGMQMATFDGFLAANPEERPFILSRSGFFGSSRYAAIWAGDNLSNYFYLANSIPCALGLSISGQPFNGMDVGGFGNDVSDALMLDWMKLAFLFPFCRNHSKKDCRRQEPFYFPKSVMLILRKYIRLRYALLPYLYNEFIKHEETGDPILRPVMYEFPGKPNETLDDQFLIGPSVLQAPFVSAEMKRAVRLPGRRPWFDLSQGTWVSEQKLSAFRSRQGTPIFIRSGAVLPMATEVPTDGNIDLKQVEFHVFLDEKSVQSEYVYTVDDGLGFGYKQGQESKVKLTVAAVSGHVAIASEWLNETLGKFDLTFVLYGDVKSLKVDGENRVLESVKIAPIEKTFSVKRG